MAANEMPLRACSWIAKAHDAAARASGRWGNFLGDAKSFGATIAAALAAIAREQQQLDPFVGDQKLHERISFADPPI
jgi:hypothetical protein